MISLIALYYTGGYDEFEFSSLLFTILPITIIYIAGFIRFALKFPYTTSIKKLSPLVFNLQFFFIITLYIVAFSVILINPWFKDSLTTSMVNWTVLCCEIGHAVFVATSLASLMELREVR